jgi:t-SNARE complex subunit (syntaxin)
MSDPKQEDPPAARARRGRNIAIALGLVAFVVIVYVVTVVRLGANVVERSF